MFSPKWVKEAKLLHKGAKKFLDYKRDLLKPDRIDEIQSRRADLLAAIKAGDKTKAEEAGKQLRVTCEKALPAFPAQAWWEEQVEVIWVALVIALGLRAYVLQPFRIPTGSMQPTLNGITVTPFQADEKAPNFLKQGIDFVARGRKYVNIVAPGSGHMTKAEDTSWFLFTETTVHMSDGSRIKVPAAENEATRPFLVLIPGQNPLAKDFTKGETIFSGTIDSGDLVLVDKISYHFRHPKRGEVFVFDTRGLPTKRGYSNMAAQEEGTHFIKRLVGVPGDRIQVNPPELVINGAIPSEPWIRRVMDCQGIYGEKTVNHPEAGYQLVKNYEAPGYPHAITGPDRVLALSKDAPRGMREYAAMGDNVGNSLDSRFWGSVKEYNLVGTGFFSLWPFSTGHWGFIK